jgi:hypothetical protein
MMKAHWVDGMAVGAWPNDGACTRIISKENQSFGNSTPCLGSAHTWVTVQSLGFPGRKLTKISKKKTQNRLILKGEMSDSSSFHRA